MQFQGLENPAQGSSHHSPALSGFVTELMGPKPAKGRMLATVLLVARLQWGRGNLGSSV